MPGAGADQTGPVPESAIRDFGLREQEPLKESGGSATLTEDVLCGLWKK